MPSYTKTLSVVLWGDMGMWTQPAFRTEKLSYPVPTMASLREMVESIYWKPEVSTVPEELWLLNEPKMTSMRVRELASPPRLGVKDPSKDVSLTQYTMVQTPKYLLRFRYLCHDQNPTKHTDIWERRLSKGQCFRQPYMGIKDLPAFFEAPTGDEKPVAYSSHLGWMHADFEAGTRERPFGFILSANDGVIHFPTDKYLKLRKVVQNL